MGIALFTFQGLLAPLHGLLGWAWPARRRSALRVSRAGGLHSQAGRAHVDWAPSRPHGPLAKPLRVLRVVDACHGPASAGRMVISGRMADVCAELDRLAALEAAVS
jgi:hypothetical protein